MAELGLTQREWILCARLGLCQGDVETKSRSWMLKDDYNAGYKTKDVTIPQV